MKIFLSLVVVLVVIRALLPIAGKYYINHVLQNNLESYTGSIKDFDLILFMGRYRLEGLTLYKKTVKDRPFVKVETTEIGVEWRNLLKGKIVAQIIIDNALVQMIDSKDSKAQQFGNEEKVSSWKKTLDDIVPVSIEKVMLTNSKVIFDLKEMKGLESSSISNIEASVDYLVTANNLENKLSPFRLTGKVNKHAPINIDGGINITREPLAFNVAVQLDDFQLPTMNKLLSYYVPIDLTEGQVNVKTNISGNLKDAQGNLSVVTSDLDIISDKQSYQGAKHFFYEIAAGFVNWAVEILTDNDFHIEVPMTIESGKFKFVTDKAKLSTVNRDKQASKKKP